MNRWQSEVEVFEAGGEVGELTTSKDGRSGRRFAGLRSRPGPRDACCRSQRLALLLALFGMAACANNVGTIRAAEQGLSRDPFQVSACRFVIPIDPDGPAPATVRATLSAAAAQMSILGSERLLVAASSRSHEPGWGAGEQAEAARRTLLALGLQPEQIEARDLGPEGPRELFLNACDEAARAPGAAAGPADPEARWLFVVGTDTFAVPAKHLTPSKWIDRPFAAEQGFGFSSWFTWTGSELKAPSVPRPCEGRLYSLACEELLVVEVMDLSRSAQTSASELQPQTQLALQTRTTEFYSARCMLPAARGPSLGIRCSLRLNSLAPTTVASLRIPASAIEDRWRILDALADVIASFRRMPNQAEEGDVRGDN